MAKALVVGANGFLGSHLVDELARRGHEVTAFDRFSSVTPIYAARGVRQITGDFMNHSDVVEALHGQELLFHFVSTTTPASAENDPTVDIRTNIASTVELLDFSVKAGIKKIFFASTGGAIYGENNAQKLDEHALAEPVSPYAIGKLAIEGYLRYFRAKHGLDSVSFRISNPYGPRQRPNKKQGVIPIFLHRIHQGLPITVFGDGSMVRDYVYVEDAVRMIGESVDRGTQQSLYNVGSGTGATLSELLAVIKSVTGIVPKIEVKPVPSTYVSRVVLDTTRFRSEFDYGQFTSIEAGVAATWQKIVEGQD